MAASLKFNRILPSSTRRREQEQIVPGTTRNTFSENDGCDRRTCHFAAVLFHPMSDRWDGPSALLKCLNPETWAVGPGWYGSGPLALISQNARPFSIPVHVFSESARPRRGPRGQPGAERSDAPGNRPTPARRPEGAREPHDNGISGRTPDHSWPWRGWGGIFEMQRAGRGVTGFACRIDWARP
jgi:hypothetical protein